MALEITLLGPPRVARDGAPVVFETRKAMALLAHLALAEHPRSRDALCALLHPAQDPDRARGALRRTLSTLRKGVGEEWITVEGDSITLQRGPGLDLDVERFRALTADGASAERLGEGVALFAGGFLEGFSLRDSADFDDWQSAEAGALERELGSALRRLVDALIARGDVERAVPRAQRWLELDRLHEPAHCQLIRLYAWGGDRAAALEQYRTCVRTLSQELGVDPSRRRRCSTRRSTTGPCPRPRRPLPRRHRHPLCARRRRAELPLIGRDDELAALLDAYASAATDGRVVVIEGEAGVGKTRLADELASRACDAGAVVLAARCHDDEADMAYGPVAELLRVAVAIAESSGWPQRLAPQTLADASLLAPDLARLGSDVPERLDRTAPPRRSGCWTASLPCSPLRARATRPESCSSTTSTPPMRRRSTRSPISGAG